MGTTHAAPKASTNLRQRSGSRFRGQEGATACAHSKSKMYLASTQSSAQRDADATGDTQDHAILSAAVQGPGPHARAEDADAA